MAATSARSERRSVTARVIVVVESHDDTRALYTEFLRAHGFDVRPVPTTDAALPLVKDAAVLVTGLGVSGSFDGLGLIARVRDNPETVRLPVVVVTAHTFDHHRARAFGAGATAFLPKPCAPDVLIAAISRLVRRGSIGEPTPLAVRRRSR